MVRVYVKNLGGSDKITELAEPGDIPDFASSITEVGDANYAIEPTDWVIVTTAALTATRTWTLPAASAIEPSHPIFIFDRKGAITSANNLIIARAGADTIDDLAFNPTLTSAFSGGRFYSDQISKWTYDLAIADYGVLLDRMSTTRGAVPYRGSGAWAALAPGTSGHVLTSNGAGADPSYQSVSASAILQCLQNTYTANTNLSTQIPQDDTTPGSSEGTEVLSQAITPADNTNKVLVIVHLWGAVSTGSNPIAVAVFRGTTCIQVALHYQGTANFPESVSCAFLDSPASASAQTYSVRVGPVAAINVRLNGTITGGRFFGGTSSATLTVMEVSA